MYYWKIDKLIDALKNDTLSEKSKVLYFLCCSGFYYFVFLLCHYIGLIPLKYIVSMNYLQEVIALILYTACIAITYKINSKFDNKNFIVRFVAIDFVYFVRIFPFFIILYSIAQVLFYALGLEKLLTEIQKDSIDLIIWVLYFLTLNFKVISAFKKLSK